MKDHIVYIDDDTEDLEIFRLAVDKCGKDINYSGFSDAKDALKKITSDELRPAMIFLDLNMPEMTGQQFLAHLTNHHPLLNIPVIVYSTTSHPATVALMKELGAREFITKHHSIDGLIADLQRLIN